MPQAAASCGEEKETGLPSIAISPPRGALLAARILMNVDFPAPLSPRSARTSPKRMSRSTPDKAVKAPNRLQTLRAATNSGEGAGEELTVVRRHPPEQVPPQLRITRPIDEGARQPVRPDIGGPGRGAA